MQFSANSFVGTVESLLSEGEGALAHLVDAYNWGVIHLKEIHRYAKNYQQQWLRREIIRVFNVDPQLYVRVAHHVGGGRTAEQFRKGRVLIQRYGFHAMWRAENMLTNEQMASLPSKINDATTPEDFTRIVDDMAEAHRVKPSTDPGKIDYRREYLKLLKENSELKREVKVLREFQEKFERYMARRAKTNA